MPMIDDGKRAPRAPEDLTLRLGPRIGQRLGEAGDREICRRGPSRKLSERMSPMFAAHQRKVSGDSQTRRFTKCDDPARLA